MNCGGGNLPSVTNAGKDFLLVFMENERFEDLAEISDPLYSQDVYIAAVDDTATVTITCKKFPNFSKTILLQRQTGKSVKLNSPQFPSFIVLQDSLHNSLVDSSVVRVRSTSPIVCFGMNHKNQTADAWVAFPENVAATGYMVMSYTNSTNEYFANHRMPGEFAVAAYSDNTKITITPSANTSSGIAAGTTIERILNAGECIQIQGDTTEILGDLTGSLVTSDKPIAVFAGHKRTETPHDYFWHDQSSHTSRDHLAEQIPPYSTWGSSFVVTSLATQVAGTLIRVMAANDNTIVKINGIVWDVPLMKAQYRDTIIQGGVTTGERFYALESSQPILVGTFGHSSDASEVGDPFFAIIPPLDQTYTDFSYVIPTTSTYADNNHITIVSQQVGSGYMFLNDVALDQSAFENVSLPIKVNGRLDNYSVLTMNQPSGFNRIQSTTSPDKGFTILSYGFGKLDSYGYAAGALLKPLRGLMQMKDQTASSPAPGSSPKLPSYILRNIMNAPVYLDSMRISYSSNPEKIIVEGKNVSMNYLSVLNMGEEMPLVLSPRQSPNEPISGAATIYSHTGLWRDFEPMILPFTIQPGSMAFVTSNATQSFTSELYPNPVRSVATLDFTLLSPAHTKIEIVDALGRIIATPSNQFMSEGTHQISISATGLPNGSYSYCISSQEFGTMGRGEFIVSH